MEKVKANAREACLVTHPDSRCVHACVAISCAIAALVNGATVSDAIRCADEQSERVFNGFFAKGIDDPISSYGLAEHGRMEDSDRTLFASFHALKHADSFLDGLSLVVGEGGDATANGAVAGAVLGARFGFSRIPYDLVYQLRQAVELEDRLQERQMVGFGVTDAGKDDVLVTDKTAGWLKLLSAAENAFLSLYTLGIGAVRWCARGSIKVISLLSGWLTQDTYHVTNDESGDELLEFVGSSQRDTLILRVVVILLLIMAVIQIGSIYQDAFRRLFRLRVEGVLQPPDQQTLIIRLSEPVGSTAAGTAGASTSRTVADETPISSRSEEVPALVGSGARCPICGSLNGRPRRE